MKPNPPLPIDTSVRKCDYEIEAQGKRCRGRLIKTYKETLRLDIEYLELTKDLAKNRAQWYSMIPTNNPI